MSSYDQSRLLWGLGMAGLGVYCALNPGTTKFLIPFGLTLYCNPGNLAKGGQAWIDNGQKHAKAAEDLNNYMIGTQAKMVTSDRDNLETSARKLSRDMHGSAQNHIGVGNFLNGMAGLGFKGIVALDVIGGSLAAIAIAAKVASGVPVLGAAAQAANNFVGVAASRTLAFMAKHKVVAAGAGTLVLGFIVNDNMSKRSSLQGRKDAVFQPVDLPLSNPQLNGGTYVPGPPKNATTTGTGTTTTGIGI